MAFETEELADGLKEPRRRRVIVSEDDFLYPRNSEPGRKIA